MAKNKTLVLVLFILVVSLSSCGIFGKGCGCPTFGYNRTGPKPASSAMHTTLAVAAKKA